MFTPTPEQRRILDAIQADSTVVVQADPGSGKTTTLLATVEQAITQGTSASRIQALSFSVRQSQDMAEKLAARGLGIACGTCHSLAYRLVSNNAQRLEIREPVRVHSSPWDRRDHDHPLWSFWERSMELFPGKTRRSEAEKHFRETCKGLGVATYDDLIEYALLVLDREWDSVEVDLLCVDEAQDFREPEIELIERIKFKNRLILGDRNQTIYTWRGASDRLFDLQGTHLTLSDNFRSIREIVEIANRFMGTQMHAMDMRVNPIYANSSRIIDEENIGEEIEYIWQYIVRDIDEGKSVAVLTRTNWYADKVRDELRNFGIECSGDEVSMFDEPWFKRFMAALRLFTDQTSNVDCEYVYRLSTQELKAALDEQIFYYDSVCKSRGINPVETAKEMEAYDAIRYMLIQALGGKDAADRWSDAKYLFKTSHCGSVDSFLRYLEDLARTPAALPTDKVFVGPVHAAKGLEWDTVIVSGCYTGHFPIQKKDSSALEEKRIFYVAMTRPRFDLCFTWSRNQTAWNGAQVVVDASQYLNTIVEG